MNVCFCFSCLLRTPIFIEGAEQIWVHLWDLKKTLPLHMLVGEGRSMGKNDSLYLHWWQSSLCWRPNSCCLKKALVTHCHLEAYYLGSTNQPSPKWPCDLWRLWRREVPSPEVAQFWRNGDSKVQIWKDPGPSNLLWCHRHHPHQDMPASSDTPSYWLIIQRTIAWYCRLIWDSETLSLAVKGAWTTS